MQTATTLNPPKETVNSAASDALRSLRAAIEGGEVAPDAFAGFIASCLTEGSGRVMQQGANAALQGVEGALAVRPLADALIDALGRLEADAEPRLAAELALRRARLADTCLNDADGAARALAEGWRRLPDARMVDSATRLGGSVSSPDWDGPLVALASIGEGARQRDALRSLGAVALERRDLASARRWFGALPTDDRDARLGLARADDLEAEAADALADLRARLDRESAPSGRASAWHAIALNRRGVGDFEGARAAFLEAVHAGDTDAIIALDALHVDAGRSGERREVFEALLLTAPPTLHHAVRRRLYELVREASTEPREAAQVLKRARPRSEVSAADAFTEARKLEEAGELAAAASRLEDASTLTGDHALRLDALTRGARLHERLGQRLDAERLWRKVRAIDPRSRPALDFYRGFFEEAGDHQRLWLVLHQLHLLEADAERRYDLAGTMASLAEESLHDPDKTIEALRLVERDAPSVAARQEVRTRLRMHHAARGDWHAWVEDVEREIADLPNDAVAERVELLFSLVDAFQDPERLPMPAMVQATYQRIVALEPRQPVAIERLCTTLEEREQWEELRNVLAARIDYAEPDEILPLFERIAQLYLDHIRSDTQAIAMLEQLLELDPGNAEVAGRLRELYRKRHAAPELYESLETALAGEEDADARVAILAEQANLAEHRMLRPELAIERWRRVLEISPRHSDALAALSRLHAEQADWPAFVAVQERRIAETANKAARLPLLFDLAEALYLRIGDSDRAAVIFRTIASSVSSSATARRFLQRIFAQQRKWSELRNLFADETGRLTGRELKTYLQVLDDTVKSCLKPDTRDESLAVDVLGEIASLARNDLKDPARAAETLIRAAELAPERVEFAEEAVATVRGASLGLDLGPAWRAIGLHGLDPDARLEAWLALAAVEREGGRLVEAFEASSRALGVAAELARTDALALFERDAEAANRWEEALAALDEALARVPPDAPIVRAAHHRAIGHFAGTRLLQADLAVRHLRWVLQLVPGDAEALDELERICFSKNDFKGLDEIYRLRAESAPEGSEPRLRALRAIASLHEDVFADTERAADAYLALALDGDTSDETVDGLLRTMEARDAWDELAGALEAVILNVSAPERRGRLHLHLFDVYLDRLDERLVALDHARSVVETHDPVPERVVARLESFLGDPVLGREVAPTLETAYRRMERPDRLVEVLELRRQTADPEALPGILDDLAMLYETLSGQPGRAFDVLMERFSLAPRDVTTWDAQARLAEQLDRAETLAEAWTKALNASNGWPVDQRAQLHRRLGELLHHQLIEIDTAIVHMESALEGASAPAERRRILEALEVLHRKNADPEAFVRVKLAGADEALSASVRRKKRLEAAAALAGAIGKPAEGLAIVESLFREDPGEKEVGQVYFDLLENARRFDDLDDARTLAIGATLDSVWRDDVAFQRALFLRDRRGQWENAIFELMQLIASPDFGMNARLALLDIARAAESEGHRDVILEKLRAWYTTENDDEGLIQTLLVEAEFATPGPARAGVHVEAAELAARRFLESGRGDLVLHALQLYGHALMDTPDDPMLLRTAEALAERGGCHEEWAEVLEECVAALDSDEPMSNLHAAVGRARVATGDGDGARAAWERAIAEAPRDSSAMRMALMALAELQVSEEAWEDALRILGQLRANRPEPAEELDADALGLRAAISAERTEEAIGAARRLVSLLRAHPELDPAHPQQLTRYRADLEAMLEENGRTEELVEAILARIDDEPARDAALLALRHAGAILQSVRDDHGAQVSPGLAVAVWERLDAAAEGDDEALGELLGLYREAESHADTAMILERRAALAADRGDLGSARLYSLERVRILIDALDAGDVAVDELAVLIDDDPRDPIALGLLRGLSERPDLADAAETVLIAAHRASGNVAALARVLDARLRAGRADVAEVLELAEASRDEPMQAAVFANRGYGMDPRGELGLRCREIAIAMAVAGGSVGPKPSAITSLLAATLKELPSSAERVTAGDEILSRLRALGLNDDDAAAPIQRILIAADPSRTDDLRALERWAKANDRRDVLAELLAAQAMTLDGDRRATIELERARMLAKLPRQELAALGAYADAIAARPDLQDAHRERLALLRRHERPDEEAAASLEWLANGVPAAEREALALRALELLVARDPERALALAAEELSSSRGHAREIWLDGLEQLMAAPVTRRGAITLLAETVRADDAADALRLLTALDAEPRDGGGDPAWALWVAERLAPLQRNVGDDPDAAFSTLLEVLRMTDAPGPVVAELRHLASDVDMWRRLVQAIGARHRDKGEAPLLLSLAEVLGDRADEDPGAAANALATWHRAIETFPDSTEVRTRYEAWLREHGEYERLVASLEAHATLVEVPADRALLVLERAGILGQHLGRGADAVAAVAALVPDALPRELQPRVAETEFLLLRSAGNWGDLAEARERWRAAAADEDASDAIDLAYASVMLAPESPRTGEGLDVLEALLNRRAGDPRATMLLSTFLSQAGAKVELAAERRRECESAVELLSRHVADTDDVGRTQVLEAQLRFSEGSESRRATALALAAHHEVHGREAAALSFAAEALALAPEDSEAEALLTRIMDSGGLHLEGAELLCDVAARTGASHLFSRAAPLFADVLGAHGRAAECLERRLADAPEDAGARRLLVTLYRTMDDAVQEAGAIAVHLSHTASHDETDALAVRLGLLRAETLQDPDGAIDAFEAAMDATLADPDARAALERLYARTERHADLVAFYARVSEIPGEADRLVALSKRAQVLETRLGDVGAAVATLEEILTIDPRHRFAFASLERLARARAQWDEVDALLARQIAASDAGDMKLKLLMRRAELALERRDDPAAALTHLEAADAIEPLGRGADELVKMLEALLSADAALRPAAARLLARRYHARQDWMAHVNVLLVGVGAEEDAAARDALADALLETIRARIPRDGGQRLSLLLALMRQAPEHVATRRAIDAEVSQVEGGAARVLQFGQQWLRRAHAGREEAVADIAHWIGEIELREGHVVEAARLFERALTAVPLHPEAFSRLATIFRDNGDLARLEGLYDEREALTPEAARAAIRVARRLDTLGLSGATPDDADLDALAAEAPGDASVDAAILARLGDTRAASAASRLATRRWTTEADRSSLLQRLLDAAEAGAPERERWLRLGVAANALGQPALALRAALQLVDTSADGPELAEALGAVETAVGTDTASGERALSHLEAWISQHSAGSDARRAVTLTRARLLMAPLGRPDEAERVLEEALVSDPTFGAARRELVRAYGARGDLAAYADKAQEIASAASDPAEARSLWTELRRLAVERGDSSAAITACKALLAIDASDEVVLETLSGLLREAGRLEELAELIAVRVSAMHEGPALVALLLELGDLRLELFGDDDGASDAWREAWSAAPEARDAVVRLVELARRRGELREAAEVLAGHAGALEEAEPRGRAWCEAAEAFVAAGALEDAKDAAGAAIEALPGLLPAHDVLVRAFGQQGQFRALAAALEARAKAHTDAGERAVGMVQAAALHLDRLSDGATATNLVNLALALRPNLAEAHLLCSRIARAAGDHAAAADAIEKAVEGLPSRRRARALFDLARLALERLSDVPRARKALLDSLALDPLADDVEAAFIALCDAQGEGGAPEIVTHLERKLGVLLETREAPPGPVAMALIARVGQAAPEDPRLEAWFGIAREDPEVDPGRLLLAEAELWFRQSRWTDGIARIEKAIELFSKRKATPELVRCWHRLGEAWERQGNATAARGAYGKAHDLDGRDVPNLLALGRLLVEVGDWQEALAVNQSLMVIKDALESEQLGWVLCRLALASHALGDSGRAKQYADRLRRSHPGHPGVAIADAELGAA